MRPPAGLPLAAAATLLQLLAEVGATCPVGAPVGRVSVVDNRCVFFSSEEANFNSAQKECRKHGMNLVTIYNSTRIGIERVEPSKLRPYQRRQCLFKEFPKVANYLLNCCANDSEGLSLRDSAQLMRDQWLPRAAQLLEQRKALVERLSVDPPRAYSEPEEPGRKPAPKKAAKNRLQGAGASRKAAPKKADGGSWAPTDDADACAVARPLSRNTVERVRPGIVLFKRALPLAAQQHFADVSVALGTPDNGLSGGWYRIDADGRKHWNNRPQPGEKGDGFGQMSELASSFPPQYRDLCLHFLERARAEDRELPPMKPSLVLSNFYPPDQPGIYWHRTGAERRAEGLPCGQRLHRQRLRLRLAHGLPRGAARAGARVRGRAHFRGPVPADPPLGDAGVRGRHSQGAVHAARAEVDRVV
eukprot:TRINITY_DN4415_c0_g1_i2.p2 TRINITY_DN4415_c0_g1~~TRINITY_DN4415_c0_g1_i2.p2  ORF type:complete len:416 (+),score=78.65 TRINITY_DN4415_c0_g1_i2:84-1331(+)